MHFESRWIPDGFALKKAALADIAQGAWSAVGQGGDEPSLAWLGRLLKEHPERGREIGNLLLELGLQRGDSELAVAVLLAAGQCPWLLEVAQFLAYRLGPGEARDTLNGALATLEGRARSVQKPYACVVLTPDPALLWLADGPTLLAEVQASVLLAVPRAGGQDALDWLAELAPRLPWVAAELPKMIQVLLDGSPQQRLAALAFGLHAPARGKLKPLWQGALAAAAPWLQEPAPPSWPGPPKQTLGQVLQTLVDRR